MRVVFTGPGLSLQHIVMELEQIPRVGDYVNLDRDRTHDTGGISRYVVTVTWDPAPSRWDYERQRWVPEHPRRQPWTIWIETAYGRPERRG